MDEGNAKLGRLQDKLNELSSEKQEATVAIEQAERLIHIQKNSTNAEVFKLKGTSCDGVYSSTQPLILIE